MRDEADGLGALFEALPEGIVIADAGENLLCVNSAARSAMGIDPAVRLDSLADLDLVDLRGEDGAPVPPLRSPLRRALRGEKFAGVELAVFRAGAPTRRMTAAGGSSLEGGRVTRAMIVLRDVTEEKRVARLREEYVSHLTHDLGAPARAVQLLAASVRSKGAARKEALEPIARIERNAERLLAMVTAIQEFAPPEGYAVALRRRSCSLAQRIAGTIERLDEASRARVAFEASASACHVLADPLSIDRALDNLVAVALLHSQHVVDVTLQEGHTNAVVEIASRAVVAADAPERPPPACAGAGVSLYIAHRIAEMHGGHVAVRGETFAASTFRLVLPRLVEREGTNGARAS